MYHIKNDARAKKSAEIVVRKLNSALADHSFDQITVTSLSKNYMVSRATFYRLFDNLTDVLRYQCDQVFASLNEQRHTQLDFLNKAYALSFLQAWLDHPLILQAINDAHLMGLLTDAYRQQIEYDRRYLHQEPNFTPEDLDYVASMLPAILTSLLTVWIRHGKRESAAELLSKCEDVLRFVFDVEGQWR